MSVGEFNMRSQWEGLVGAVRERFLMSVGEFNMRSQWEGLVGGVRERVLYVSG